MLRADGLSQDRTRRRSEVNVPQLLAALPIGLEALASRERVLRPGTPHASTRLLRSFDPKLWLGTFRQGAAQRGAAAC